MVMAGVGAVMVVMVMEGVAVVTAGARVPIQPSDAKTLLQRHRSNSLMAYPHRREDEACRHPTCRHHCGL